MTEKIRAGDFYGPWSASSLPTRGVRDVWMTYILEASNSPTMVFAFRHKQRGNKMNELNKLFESFAMVVLVLGTIIGLLSISGLLFGVAWALFVEQNLKSAIIRLLIAIGLGTVLVYLVGR